MLFSGAGKWPWRTKLREQMLPVVLRRRQRKLGLCLFDCHMPLTRRYEHCVLGSCRYTWQRTRSCVAMLFTVHPDHWTILRATSQQPRLTSLHYWGNNIASFHQIAATLSPFVFSLSVSHSLSSSLSSSLSLSLSPSLSSPKGLHTRYPEVEYNHVVAVLAIRGDLSKANCQKVSWLPLPFLLLPQLEHRTLVCTCM